MSVLTFNNKRSGCYLGESAALNIINEEIIIASGAGVLDPGTVLGRILVGTATVTPGTPVSGSGQTVGNGAVGTWTADATAEDGTWKLVITNENANLGNYKVIRPDGTVDGFGIIGTAYNGTINGTLADGANDWKEDDEIPIVVSYATGRTYKYVLHDYARTDGGQNVRGILFHGVDATAADVKTVATRRGPATVNGNMLTVKSGATAGQKLQIFDALRALGLAVLPQHAN